MRSLACIGYHLVACCFHRASCLACHLVVLTCCKLVNLVFDKPCKLAVWRPESLAYAYRVFYNLCDSCIPVVTLTVIENGILANHQVVDFTICYDSSDSHVLVLSLRVTVAVGNVHSAETCSQIVLWHITYLDTEVATALVDVKRTCLEYCLCLIVTRIEIGECNEVLEQQVEIAVQMHQLVNTFDFICFAFQCLVLLYKGKKFSLAVVCENSVDSFKSERFYYSTFLSSHPFLVCCEFSTNRVPFAFGNRILACKINVED